MLNVQKQLFRMFISKPSHPCKSHSWPTWTCAHPAGRRVADRPRPPITAFITTEGQGTAGFQEANYLIKGLYDVNLSYLWLPVNHKMNTISFSSLERKLLVGKDQSPLLFLCFNVFPFRKKIPPKLSTSLSVQVRQCFHKPQPRWFQNQSFEMNVNKLLSFLSAFQCLLKNKQKLNSNALDSSSPIKRH